MDESAFRRTRGAVNPQPCAFEKALLAHCCGCSLAQRQNIAEREAVACVAPAAQAQCTALRALLRQKAAFALKVTQTAARLPHALEMKLQCGGLQGLKLALAPEGASEVDDVHELVRAGAEKFGALANLPYSAIIQSVAAYQIRRRSAKA